jgi:hypothetical protein
MFAFLWALTGAIVARDGYKCRPEPTTAEPLDARPLVEGVARLPAEDLDHHHTTRGFAA